MMPRHMHSLVYGAFTFLLRSFRIAYGSGFIYIGSIYGSESIHVNWKNIKTEKCKH